MSRSDSTVITQRSNHSAEPESLFLSSLLRLSSLPPQLRPDICRVTAEGRLPNRRYILFKAIKHMEHWNFRCNNSTMLIRRRLLSLLGIILRLPFLGFYCSDQSPRAAAALS